MTDVTLRPAAEEDVIAIARLEQTVFTDGWSAEAVRSHLSTAGAYATVALRCGRMLGYLLAIRLPMADGLPSEGELYRIAVAEEARGQGVGGALLSQLLEGLDICFLEVRDSNRAAISLYEKAGFTLSAIRRRYYKEPTEDARIYRYERPTSEWRTS